MGYSRRPTEIADRTEAGTDRPEQTVEQPAKRKRGRPRKTAGSGTPADQQPPSTETGGQEKVTVEESPALIAPQKRGVRSRKPANTKQAENIVNVLEVLAVSWAGPVASFEAHERVLIVNGIASIIANMGSQTYQKLESIASPAGLALGLGLWALRVSASKKTVKPIAQPAPPEAGQGDREEVRTTYTDEQTAKWFEIDWGQGL